MKSIFASIVVAALFLAPGAGIAAPANPTKLLAAIPQPAFDGAFATGSPVSAGLNGFNRGGWVGVGEQSGAMIPIDRGAITGDAAMVDKYWPVIDVSFAHQLKNGSFYFAPVVNGRTNDPRGEPTAEGFWIGASAQAILLLRSSPLAPRYASRIDALIPKYRASLLWLSRPEQIDAMLGADSTAANRLFFDARALLLGNLIAPVPQARLAGERLLAHALAMQAAEGYFNESGGADTSYSAVSCLNLAEMALFLDDPRIPAALSRGLAWELGRIDPDGHVSEAGNTRTGNGKMTNAGRPYSVNYPQVIQMFAIAGALTGDAAATDAAKRIAAYHISHR